jgi:DNA-binding IclR family transcriptional regulator
MAKQRRKRDPNASASQLATAEETSKAPAITRAAAVLRFLSRSDLPLGVQSIARELDLFPSTCLHVLRALVAEHLVAFDPETKRYSLDAGVLMLAEHWLKRNRFTDIAQPILDRLAEKYDVAALGMQVVGLDHVIVVGSAQPKSNIQVSVKLGSRFPSLASAMGHCVAAFSDYSDEELKVRFNDLNWDTPLSFQEWKTQIRQTRAQGFSVDDGHYMAGITIITAPVFTANNRMSHALVTFGLSRTLKRKELEAIEHAIVFSARLISQQLARVLISEEQKVVAPMDMTNPIEDEALRRAGRKRKITPR